MREFVLMALKARTTPDFKLGGADRMDLVCRTISNSIFISNDIRRDTVIHVCLSGPTLPPKIVSFYGATLQGLDPDENSIAEAIRKALEAGKNLKLGEEANVHPGIKVSKKAFEGLLKEMFGRCQLIYLHSKGKDVRKFEFKENVAVVLGDFIGMPRKSEIFLDRMGAERMTLGPKMLFASHCPIIVHNELDRRENEA